MENKATDQASNTIRNLIGNIDGNISRGRSDNAKATFSRIDDTKMELPAQGHIIVGELL